MNKVDENSPAMKRRAEIMAKVFEHNDRPIIESAEGVRALVNGIWDTTHNEELDHSVMLQDLCLLSGMACAALSDYAKQLEEEA